MFIHQSILGEVAYFHGKLHNSSNYDLFSSWWWPGEAPASWLLELWWFASAEDDLACKPLPSLSVFFVSSTCTSSSTVITTACCPKGPGTMVSFPFLCSSIWMISVSCVFFSFLFWKKQNRTKVSKESKTSPPEKMNKTTMTMGGLFGEGELLDWVEAIFVFQLYQSIDDVLKMLIVWNMLCGFGALLKCWFIGNTLVWSYAIV